MPYISTLVLFSLLFFTACGEESKKIKISPLLPIYNQAYQENFKPDTINEILKNAKNGYVLLDPFEKNLSNEIVTIKENGNMVAGYISVGTGENYRDDFKELEPFLVTKSWEEWSDEFYVSNTTTGVLEVMKKRIDKMALWGIEWVEFDNMDWVNDENREKYSIKSTEQEAQQYIQKLCDYSREKGIKCMAKNITQSFENFDGVLYESSLNNKNWWDKEGTKGFLDEGKLVIINHYNEKDCDAVYDEYKNYYNNNHISFICEDTSTEKYKHYNQE